MSDIVKRLRILDENRAADEIERLRVLIRETQTAVDGSMRDLWIAVREPEKSGLSVDHALGHLAQSLTPLRREALGDE